MAPLSFSRFEDDQKLSQRTASARHGGLLNHRFEGPRLEVSQIGSRACISRAASNPEFSILPVTHGVSMHYSFTEKKRIRKSFAKRASVQHVPFLLATQLESYTGFLQADKAPSQRKNEGLQAAFTSIFPICQPIGQCAPRVRQLRAGRSAVRRQGMPAARPHLRVAAARQGAPGDHGQGTPTKPTVKEVKEQEVYMGESRS